MKLRDKSLDLTSLQAHSDEPPSLATLSPWSLLGTSSEVCPVDAQCHTQPALGRPQFCPQMPGSSTCQLFTLPPSTLDVPRFIYCDTPHLVTDKRHIWKYSLAKSS